MAGYYKAGVGWINDPEPTAPPVVIPPPVETSPPVATTPPKKAPPKGPAVEDGGTFAPPKAPPKAPPPVVVAPPPVVVAPPKAPPKGPAVEDGGTFRETGAPLTRTNPNATPTATPTDTTTAGPPAMTGVTPAVYTTPSPTAPTTPGKKPPAPPPPPPPADKTPPPPSGPTYVPKGQEMLAGAEQSYGKNAADTLRMAMESGRQFGDIAAGEGGRAATGYARASGLSPAQAALLAGQGAEGAYSGGLGQGVDKYMGAARDISSLGLGEQGQGLQKYGLDLGKYGTDVNAATQKYGIDKGVQTQGTSNFMNLLGTGASAAAALLPIFLKDGTNSAQGGLTVVGEEGPELVNMPAGSQVVPHGQSKKLIKDGYDILSAVSDAVGKKPAKVEKLAQVSITSAPAKNTHAEMSDKLDKVFQYLKAQ